MMSVLVTVTSRFSVFNKANVSLHPMLKIARQWKCQVCCQQQGFLSTGLPSLYPGVGFHCQKIQFHSTQTINFNEKCKSSGGFAAFACTQYEGISGLPTLQRHYLNVGSNYDGIRQYSTSEPEGESPKFRALSSLTPFEEQKWTIRARVSQKSDVIHWSNEKGEGSLLSLTLLDESGEMKATAFNEESTRLFDRLELGKVYYISGGYLSAARKQYTSVANDYQIVFTKDTEVVECREEVDLPDTRFSFTNISDVLQLDPGIVVDVVGLVARPGYLTYTAVKGSDELVALRNVWLADDSGESIRVTLWRDDAHLLEDEDEGRPTAVVAVKEARVTEYNDVRSLSLMRSSIILVNPDLPEAHQLKTWHQHNPIDLHNTD